MDDCRVLRLRACAVAQPTEAARLNAEVETLLAARAAGQSQWGSELPPLFLLLVLQYVRWDPAVCSVIRAVCSTWSSIHDALRPGRLPRLLSRRSAAIMQGKLSWFKSLTELDLTGCGDTVSGVMVELQSMPCLRSLWLPSSCAERAVDAEAVCAITTLTTLDFYVELDENNVPVEEVGEWVLDLSRLTTLNALDLKYCHAVMDKEVLALSHLTGLEYLNLNYCINVSSEGLRAVSSLTALSTLALNNCPNATSEVLRAVSSLTALSTLGLAGCDNVSSEGLRAVSSLTGLTVLSLNDCQGVTNEGLRAISSLAALSALYLRGCDNVTAAGKQALRTAIPNLTILD
jgi:hypothetical protein